MSSPLSFDDGTLAWYENINGQATFGPQRLISTQLVSPRGCMHRIWMAMAIWMCSPAVRLNDDKIAWYENLDGDGTFGAATGDHHRRRRCLSRHGGRPGSEMAIRTCFLVLGRRQIAWYENLDGSGTFESRLIATVERPSELSVTDVDGDGDPDLVPQIGSNRIAWIRNESPTGDFNNDGVFDCVDIDALTAEIATGTNNPLFDLTGDGLVDLADRDAWLAVAGEVNLGPGKVYLLGDATLNGSVDGEDFIAWNSNKFTSNTSWCGGNFNADLVVDAVDFIIWNDNKFQSSDGPPLIEPLKRNGRAVDIKEASQAEFDNETAVHASSDAPRLTALTANRVDSLFAISRREEPAEQGDHDDLADGIPIFPYLL